MIRAVLPDMREQGDGRIVNIVGQAARHPHADRLPSGTTNAAQAAMTKSIADALGRENIRVNAVCPQYVETELLASLIEKEIREASGLVPKPDAEGDAAPKDQAEHEEQRAPAEELVE